MRTRVTTDTLCQFDELSDNAKEKAREWMRNANAQDSDSLEHVAEEFHSTIAPMLGFTIDPQRGSRTRKAVWYSVAYCQGDGACFEGSWSASKVNLAKVREELVTDVDLHEIATTLDAIAQVDDDKEFSARVTQRGRYFHSEIETYGLSDEQDADFKEAVYQLNQWLYSWLRKEVDYQNSDEVIDENITCNEYEFLESGERA